METALPEPEAELGDRTRIETRVGARVILVLVVGVGREV